MSTHSYKHDESGRAEPPGQLGSDPLQEQADSMIGYYQDLLDRQHDPRWLLGLYMAKQWLRYLNEPQRDMQEVRLFVRALESQRQNQGSGWSDLWGRARNWVDQIERD